jgi:hypothetical protein
MILSGYLAGQYAQTVPLAVNAIDHIRAVVRRVEGDSASSTELYALLSALQIRLYGKESQLPAQLTRMAGFVPSAVSHAR